MVDPQYNYTYAVNWQSLGHFIKFSFAFAFLSKHLRASVAIFRNQQLFTQCIAPTGQKAQNDTVVFSYRFIDITNFCTNWFQFKT